MSGPRSRRRRDEELLDALDRLTTPRRRASLLGLVWAWRKELALAVGSAVLLVVVIRTSGIAWAVVGLSAAVGALSPPWSEHLRAFWWRLITPHRLSAGLYHARIYNRSGRRPMIIQIASEPFGERVRLWCPAGISAEDVYSAREVLRGACWASDVRVTRDQRRSQIVTVDVIRRPDDIQPSDDDQHQVPCRAG